ncbi:MAG: hypothetical protein HRU09_13145 [Oligoflexales bacterium]|nr:hypothetical protein [Oligoflexales bacterium]
MIKALIVMGLSISFSCRADQSTRQKSKPPEPDELKLCISQNPEQMTCIFSKHNHWTLVVSFPQNQLALNSYVELRQSESCLFKASFAEPGKPALRSCIEGRESDESYASFEVGHIDDKKITLKDINMTLLDKSGENQKQISYERLEFKRQDPVIQ